MFTFEDPVGLQLSQDPGGKLTGRGCAAGSPGGPTFDMSPGNAPLYCGDISGEVHGLSATFGFPIEFGPNLRYAAEVAISADGRRMAGVFKTSSGDLPPMAWLRVADDASWLEIDVDEIEDRAPLLGSYELTLDIAASSGTEYVPSRTYVLHYWSRGIGGELGSFWHTEMSPVGAGSPQRVGPVPPTIPVLPISLTLEFDGGLIRRVTATTASGGLYTFTAKRTSTDSG